MSFDPITLALAKNYTDEKVGNGGGSGSGLSVVTIATQFETEHEFVNMTEEEAAQMDAAVKAGTPLIICMPNPSMHIMSRVLCYDWIVMNLSNGVVAQYVAKNDGMRMGYVVIRKADFNQPWQVAYGNDLEQMIM